MTGDMFEIVGLHIRRLARRVLNDRAKAGQPIPRQEVLASALEGYVSQQCGHVIYWHDYGEPRASARSRRGWLDGDEGVERVARSAARYTLERWSPGYIQERQRRGAVGGRKSKRTATWTDADLDALAALKGLTVTQQMEETGHTRRTIERMRAALRRRALLQ